MREQVFAVKHKDASHRQASASGAAFVAFSETVLAIGGVVCGAAWDKHDWSVKHRRVEASEDLASLKGSKYVPSDFTHVIPQLEADLASGRLVLFSGTPCQVAAILKQFPKSVNLITVEIFCHGIPDGSVWKAYLETLGDGIVAIDFKDKRKGWTRPSFVVSYSDGHERVEDCYANPYVRAFMSGLSMRRGCFACPFKSGKSGADISIGDYWGIASAHAGFADECGVSVVVVHTDEGLRAWKMTEGRVNAIESSFEKFLPRNPNYAKSCCEPKNRDLFLRCYFKRPMGYLVMRCLEGPWIVRFARRVYGKIWRILCA